MGESGLLGRWSVTPAGAPVGCAGRASGEVLSARAASVPGHRRGWQPTTVQGGLAFRWIFRQTRAVEAFSDSDPREHAGEAGEQMGSELDAIQERLRMLKRRLDARQRVADLEDEIARGDPVEMNPLTAGDQ